jgi:general secretion pathway protein H
MTARHREARSRGKSRGLTLIELLVTLTVISLVTTAVVFGTGAVAASRVRGAATMIAGAIRIAFTRASAVSRPSRVVLVLSKEDPRVILEETTNTLLIKQDDTAGGAEAATPEEREAVAQADRILKGPRAPRPRFAAIKAFGFDQPDTGQGRPLGKGVSFRKVETGHSTDGETEGRAYLYFWPGGRTERAAIQLQAAASTNPNDGLTLLVSPLTGKVRIVQGAKSMEPLRDDGTSSEREDRAF